MRSKSPKAVANVRGSEVRQSPKNSPTVSVVILCYNYAQFLPSAVGSALSQIGVEIEVIIVDDASTDRSIEVARALAARDPRVRVVENGRNQGMVATFNNGLAVANGDYLIRLDADDMLTPGSVGRAIALFEEFPQVGLVYGHPLHFSTPVAPQHRDRATSWDIFVGRSWLEMRCRLAQNCITSPEVVMRASVVNRVGGQRDLTHTPDFEMWLRMARVSDIGWIGGSDQAWHRDHADSMSAQGLDVITDYHERARAFEILLTDGEGDPAEDARLLQLARTTLAGEALASAAYSFVRGRGATSEPEKYIEFADSMGVDPASLRHSGSLRSAQRAGARLAPFSPHLVLWATRYRVSRELGASRWRSRGI